MVLVDFVFTFAKIINILRKYKKEAGKSQPLHVRMSYNRNVGL